MHRGLIGFCCLARLLMISHAFLFLVKLCYYFSCLHCLFQWPNCSFTAPFVMPLPWCTAVNFYNSRALWISLIKQGQLLGHVTHRVVCVLSSEQVSSLLSTTLFTSPRLCTGQNFLFRTQPCYLQQQELPGNTKAWLCGSLPW